MCKLVRIVTVIIIIMIIIINKKNCMDICNELTEAEFVVWVNGIPRKGMVSYLHWFVTNKDIYIAHAGRESGGA